MDRNIKKQEEAARNFPSLSARRAWIEITNDEIFAVDCRVALRKESVDRNKRAAVFSSRRPCRSPQGERG